VHTFKVETAGWPANEQQVLVPEGEKNKVLNVQFGTAEPEGAPSKPMYRPTPGLTDGLLGAAVGFAGVGTGLGAAGKSQKSSEMKSCAPFCSDKEVNGVKTLLLGADIGFGLAVVSVGAAAVVYFSRPSKELPDDSTKPGKDSGPKTSFSVDPVRDGATFNL